MLLMYFFFLFEFQSEFQNKNYLFKIPNQYFYNIWDNCDN